MALILLKNGIPVRIIEKDTKFHIGSRGSGIHVQSLLERLFMSFNNSTLGTHFGSLQISWYLRRGPQKCD